MMNDFRSNPDWIMGLANIAGRNPAEAMKEHQQMQIQQAQLQQAEDEKRQQAALKSALSSSGGSITPDMIEKILQIDPMLGIELAQKYQASQQPDMSYQFNPVTGDLVSIDKASGNAALLPVGGRSNAIEGVPPEIAGNPRAVQKYMETKAQKEAEISSEKPIKETARKSLNYSLDELEGLTSSLNEKGGLIDPKNSTSKNIGTALVTATDLGQTVARATGSDAQPIRDEIKSVMPAIIQDIKRATGMTATEINSIPELKLLQSAAGGDVSLNYQTIKNNIARLRRKYVTQDFDATPARSEVEAELRRRGLLK